MERSLILGISLYGVLLTDVMMSGESGRLQWQLRYTSHPTLQIYYSFPMYTFFHKVPPFIKSADCHVCTHVEGKPVLHSQGLGFSSWPGGLLS
jgi:hypothetical protein